MLLIDLIVFAILAYLGFANAGTVMGFVFTLATWLFGFAIVVNMIQMARIEHQEEEE